MYKLYIPKFDYSEWYWYDENNMELLQGILSINPLEFKLFNNDVIDSSYNLLYSDVRTSKYIAGILLLVGKTYGRFNNKLVYKCVPNDPKLPIFLIPYENKRSEFNKKKYNKFVLFKFNEWNNKHPTAELISNLGNINELSAYYEYQLYCKNLCHSIKEFTNEVRIKMKDVDQKKYLYETISIHKNILNRTENYIFTIDPKLSSDLDDAIGIENNIISIYIANVPLLIDFYDFWDSFSERIATIYLPDRKRPMLPTLLSENACSLLENEERLAFVIDIQLSQDFKSIDNISFNNSLIKVKKNYRYNDLELSNDKIYNNIFKISCDLCKKYKYIKEIKDSHDLIAFWMIVMNFYSAKTMIQYKDGIYRTLKIKEDVNINFENIPNEIYNFIKIWQSSSGQYTNFINRENHDLMAPCIEEYLHITSPIRRLVDLLNMMKIQHLLGLNNLSEKATNFYNKWLNNLDYINTTMRSIRKVQTDCNTIFNCFNNNEIINNLLKGFVFDKIDWKNQFLQYTVYIPSIKIITRINTKEDLQEFTEHTFKLFLIEDGITLKKKVRAELVLNANL